MKGGGKGSKIGDSLDALKGSLMRRMFRLVLVLFVAAFSLYAQDAVFKVGFAEADITPQKPMPMWGYGDRHDALSTGIRDPLHAKAVVIDVGKDKLAIVGLDLGRSPMSDMMARIKETVLKKAGVNYVMMSGSHTHHGPVLELLDEEGKGKGKFDDGVKYVEGLEGMLTDAILDAAKNVVDAKMGVASKQIDMNRNRHSKKEPKPRETELGVLRFDDTSGKTIALVVNFSAHPTMLPGGDLRFSAEYPGGMMNAVEKEFGAHCVFMQGSAGDMSVQTTPETNTPETFGAALAAEVMALAKGIATAKPEAPSITGMTKEYELVPRVDLASPMIQGILKQAFFPELGNRALDEVGKGSIKPVLTVTVLNGNLALVGASGEFFSNHSIRLKERSPMKTLFFGYCDGHHMYFPTIEGAAEGGYGGDATVSWVPVGTGEMMMNDALVYIFKANGAFENPMDRT